MAPNKAIQTLKTLAATNKTANDVFHEMALRERTRNQITVRGLALRMARAGFKHDLAAYRMVIKAMADCGFGVAKYNKTGEIVGVHGIKTTLQSIGRAVIDGASDLKNVGNRNKYSPIKMSNDPVPARTEMQKAQVAFDLSKSADLVKRILDSDTPSERKLELLNVLMK